MNYTDPVRSSQASLIPIPVTPALLPKIRILIGAVVAIGPGKADLLAAIERTGSISAAAREMKMSYRRAWLLVEAMNSAFRQPLVETLTGGDGGGCGARHEIGRGSPSPVPRHGIENGALGRTGAQAAFQAHRAGSPRQVALPFARNRRRGHEALSSPTSRTGVRRYPPRDPLRSQ